MPPGYSPKTLFLVLALCAGLLLSAANTHLHLDNNDQLSCNVCLLGNHDDSVVDPTVHGLSAQAVAAVTQTAISLPLQQTILGFLSRGPPSALPL